jgi:hypothetical protein
VRVSDALDMDGGAASRIHRHATATVRILARSPVL